MDAQECSAMIRVLEEKYRVMNGFVRKEVLECMLTAQMWMERVLKDLTAGGVGVMVPQDGGVRVAMSLGYAGIPEMLEKNKNDLALMAGVWIKVVEDIDETSFTPMTALSVIQIVVELTKACMWLEVNLRAHEEEEERIRKRESVEQ